jgi:VIT1/CCC1 family predicted Fe2+/Mn2+ transporter
VQEVAVKVESGGEHYGSVLRGLSFGLTSGVLTTLGLMVGLNSGTGSDEAVAAGVLTIAITDALSDSLGVHVSEESTGAGTREIWVATIATFLTKFLFALTFLVPVVLFPLGTAVLVSIAWGAVVLIAFSWYIAHQNGDLARVVIGEHLLIGGLVLLSGQLAGAGIDRLF